MSQHNVRITAGLNFTCASISQGNIPTLYTLPLGESVCQPQDSHTLTLTSAHLTGICATSSAKLITLCKFVWFIFTLCVMFLGIVIMLKLVKINIVSWVLSNTQVLAKSRYPQNIYDSLNCVFPHWQIDWFTKLLMSPSQGPQEQYTSLSSRMTILRSYQAVFTKWRSKWVGPNPPRYSSYHPVTWLLWARTRKMRVRPTLADHCTEGLI